jgi:hypothetical protein
MRGNDGIIGESALMRFGAFDADTIALVSFLVAFYGGNRREAAKRDPRRF